MQRSCAWAFTAPIAQSCAYGDRFRHRLQGSLSRGGTRCPQLVAKHARYRRLNLRDRALEAKAKEFWDIIKIGRTHFNGCDTDSAWTGILRLRTAGRLCQRTRTKVG